MENIRKTTLEMQTLLLCADVQFLGITRNVLNQLQVAPKIVGNCEAALTLIQEHEFDVIIVDWREIDNLSDFRAVRKSRKNQQCVLVAIMRDLLDLRQAFAAGVHLLIHKPASAVQIEHCLRAAYCATVARRRDWATDRRPERDGACGADCWGGSGYPFCPARRRGDTPHHGKGGLDDAAFLWCQVQLYS